MKSQEFKMPAFGVGPIYVLTCLFLTMIGVYLHIKGFLSAGEFTEGKIYFIVFGILLILFGLYLWIEAVICLLYTSPSPRDKRQSRMPSSA